MKKYRVLSLASLLLLLTTLVSYGFFAVYNFGLNPISQITDLASGFNFVIPTQYLQLLDNLKKYSDILTNIQHDIVIVYAMVWAGLTLGVVLIFILANYIVKHKKNPIFSLIFAFLVSCYLTYFSFTNFIHTLSHVSKFLVVNLNFGLIFLISIAAVIIYGIEIYKKSRKLEIRHVEIIVNKLFKLGLITIIIIIGFKVVGQLISYYVLILAVNQIDFAAWINISDIFTTLTDTTITNLMPPAIIKIIDAISQNNSGMSAINDLSNVAINSLADKFLLNNLTTIVQNFLINIFRPIIFTNVYYYLSLIIVSVVGLNLRVFNKIPVNYLISICKIVVSLFLIIILLVKVNGFYVLYINLLLVIVVVYYAGYIIYDMKLIHKLFKKE